MVDLGISEFTFGFAFLYEQTHRNWGGLTAAPVLPSLQKEKDEGWDAHLPLSGTDFYYQFKLTDYLSRSNAMYIRDDTYSAPYYRISLHRRENNLQHQRLREHCATHPNTYYVAPELNAIADFNDAYLSRGLTQRSRIIPLNDCDDVDDGDQHYITFQQGSPTWIQHSQKKMHGRSYFGRDLSGLYRSSSNDWRRIDQAFVFELARTSIETVSGRLKKEFPGIGQGLGALDFPPDLPPREALARTAQLIAAVFGLTLVLVGEARE
jgi:hypothetical protein